MSNFAMKSSLQNRKIMIFYRQVKGIFYKKSKNFKNQNFKYLNLKMLIKKLINILIINQKIKLNYESNLEKRLILIFKFKTI